MNSTHSTSFLHCLELKFYMFFKKNGVNNVLVNLVEDLHIKFIVSFLQCTYSHVDYRSVHQQIKPINRESSLMASPDAREKLDLSSVCSYCTLPSWYRFIHLDVVSKVWHGRLFLFTNFFTNNNYLVCSRNMQCIYFPPRLLSMHACKVNLLPTHFVNFTRWMAKVKKKHFNQSLSKKSMWLRSKYYVEV
jgi:hypothetical protein